MMDAGANVNKQAKGDEETPGVDRQPWKEYNRKHYNDNVFNITDETQGNRIILL